MRYFLCLKNKVPTRVDLLSVEPIGNGLVECCDICGQVHVLDESEVFTDFD